MTDTNFFSPIEDECTTSKFIVVWYIIMCIISVANLYWFSLEFIKPIMLRESKES